MTGQTYLSQNVGIAIVDIVTTLSTNLQGELMQRIRVKLALSPLYATAYRTVIHASVS